MPIQQFPPRNRAVNKLSIELKSKGFAVERRNKANGGEIRKRVEKGKSI